MLFLKKKTPGDVPVQTSHLTSTQTQFLRFVKNTVEMICGPGLCSIKGSVHQRGVKRSCHRVICVYIANIYIYIYIYIYNTYMKNKTNIHWNIAGKNQFHN